MKKYMLFQGISRLTKAHKKTSEQIKGLQNAYFYTEEEMLATMLDTAEEGTFFMCECYDFDNLYCLSFYCDNYMKDGSVDTDKLKKDFYKRRANKKDEE